MQKFRSIAISCKAKDLLDKLTELTGKKKAFYVSELIEKAYNEEQEKGV